MGAPPKFRENDADAASMLCEAVHTSFRKGCDGGIDVWLAIHDLEPGELRKAMDFVVYGLRASGVRIVFETGEPQT